MKTLLATTLILALCPPAFAQTGDELDFSRIGEEHVDIKNDPKKLVSWYSFYTHVNNNLSTYLVGSEDLTLFRNSFFLDQSNKQFNLGITFNKRDFTSKSKRGLPDLQRQKGIYRLGIYVPYSNDFGSLYKKKKPVDDTGFDLKASYIFDRSIGFGTKDQLLSNSMMIELQSLKASYQEEYDELIAKQTAVQAQLDKLNSIDKMQKLNDLQDDLKGIYPESEHGFISQDSWNSDQLLQSYFDANELKLKKLSKEIARKKSTSLIDSTLISGYSKKELEALKGYKFHSYSRISWFSVNAKVPIGNSSKVISVDSSAITRTRLQWPLEVSFFVNTALECKKVRYFGHVSYQVKNTNSATLRGLMTETQMFNIPFAASQVTGLNDEQTVFIGDYSTFFSHSFSVDLTMMRKDHESIVNHEKHIVNYGLHFNAERFFSSIYIPLNLSFGFPISLLDKDGEPTVNFEVMTILADVNNDLPSNKKEPKTVREILNIGFKVGLPLGRPIFK